MELSPWHVCKLLQLLRERDVSVKEVVWWFQEQLQWSLGLALRPGALG